jgi:hypothetical protein
MAGVVSASDHAEAPECWFFHASNLQMRMVQICRVSSQCAHSITIPVQPVRSTSSSYSNGERKRREAYCYGVSSKAEGNAPRTFILGVFLVTFWHSEGYGVVTCSVAQIHKPGRGFSRGSSCPSRRVVWRVR